MVVIGFMIEKLDAFGPLILTRDVQSYSIGRNILWFENFIDNLLCVVDSNIYKNISVSSCKILNSSDTLANRLYTITIKFKSDACPLVIKLPLKFDELTVNTAVAYVAVNKIATKILGLQATALRSANLKVYTE